MTTICWDTKKLVSDSQATAGHRARLGTSKKLFVAGPEDKWVIQGDELLVYGFAGSTGNKLVVEDYLIKGVDHTTKIPHLEGGFQILAIAKSGRVWLWGQEKPPAKDAPERRTLQQVLGPYAIGSGSGYAEAAMSIGLDAEQAVRAAINVDTMSGGDLQVWELWQAHITTVPLIAEPQSDLRDQVMEELQKLFVATTDLSPDAVAEKIQQAKDLLSSLN